jgi:hypothetical protein
VGTIFGLCILVVLAYAIYHLNMAGRESCKISLEAFIAKEMQDIQMKRSIPIDEKWRVLTQQEAKTLLTKAETSKSLDCNDIRYNYEEGDYWGKEFVISLRINESTKTLEIKIKE